MSQVNINGKIITEPKKLHRMVALYTINENDYIENHYINELTKSEIKKVIILLESFGLSKAPKIFTK